MKAGRELDILVAEKVMGKTVRSKNEVTNNSFKHEYDELVVDLGNGRYEFIRHYSTDIADAWQVLEKMQDRYQLGLMPTSFGKWVCRGYLPETAKIQVQAEAPLAICLAALEAVGWEGGEK